MTPNPLLERMATVSWNEGWTGSEQARFFKIDGDHLSIVSDWAPSATLPDAPMVRAILAWERPR